MPIGCLGDTWLGHSQRFLDWSADLLLISEADNRKCSLICLSASFPSHSPKFWKFLLRYPGAAVEKWVPRLQLAQLGHPVGHRPCLLFTFSAEEIASALPKPIALQCNPGEMDDLASSFLCSVSKLISIQPQWHTGCSHKFSVGCGYLSNFALSGFHYSWLQGLGVGQAHYFLGSAALTKVLSAHFWMFRWVEILRCLIIMCRDIRHQLWCLIKEER